MYFATFRTRSPLPQIQRALDELARAGFELRGLHMALADGGSEGEAHVRIDYAGEATVSPATYLSRLERSAEVSDARGGALYAPALRIVAQEAG